MALWDARRPLVSGGDGSRDGSGERLIVGEAVRGHTEPVLCLEAGPRVEATRKGKGKGKTGVKPGPGPSEVDHEDYNGGADMRSRVWSKVWSSRVSSPLDAAPPGGAIGEGAGGQGTVAVSGAADSALCFWDLPLPGGPPSLDPPSHRGQGADGGEAGGGSGGVVVDGEGPQGGGLHRMASTALPSPGCNRLALTADGRVLASGGWDGKVCVWVGEGRSLLESYTLLFLTF